MRISAPNWETYDLRKLWVAYGVALLVLLLLAGFTLSGLRDTADSASWVQHTYEVLDRLELAYSELNELESYQRAFLLTRDPAATAAYDRTAMAIQKDEDLLEHSTSDNPHQISNVAQLKKLIGQRELELSSAMTASLASYSPESFRALLLSRRKTKLAVRDRLDTMEKEERQLLILRLAATNRNRIMALGFFAATTTSGVLLLTGIFSLILRIIRGFGETREQQLTYSLRLEEEVERTSSVQKELVRSNHELQDFAFVASHDLQEPLRKIRSYGDRLKRRLGADLDESSATDLSRIQSAAERMQGLINDILTLSRVTSKAQPFVPVDLNTVFDEVVDDLETRIQQNDAKVIRGNLPRVNADPLQMRQLMQNLIGNALKFVRPGVLPEITVVKLETPPRGMVGFAVQDNGIGFDEKHGEKIFTMFQRLHNRAEYEGSGVGLAICRRIVERHGGYVLAQGTPGAGATFTVALPSENSTRKSQ